MTCGSNLRRWVQPFPTLFAPLVSHHSNFFFCFQDWISALQCVLAHCDCSLQNYLVHHRDKKLGQLALTNNRLLPREKTKKFKPYLALTYTTLNFFAIKELEIIF